MNFTILKKIRKLLEALSTELLLLKENCGISPLYLHHLLLTIMATLLRLILSEGSYRMISAKMPLYGLFGSRYGLLLYKWFDYPAIRDVLSTKFMEILKIMQ
jgi:hypothetical protein